jgi:HlyD family secretion protein
MKNAKNGKKSKRWIFFTGGGLVILVVVAIVIISAVGGGSAPESYQFAAVTKGAVQVTVVSTGTISATNTVNVGTQVSGPIAKIYVDYNSRVRKGQVLAELDPTLLKNTVQSATADQMKAEAQYELALQDYENNVKLHDQSLISDFDFKTSQTNKNTAYANKLGADASLARAQISLNESVIRAPIDGVIIDRAVEEGQTVAASLSAPTLFTIAQDLGRIQITAYVAESDIGSIKPGQKTTFTVAAFPKDTFTGKVDIIHLQSQTIQNVVNYVVMVNAVNPDLKLKPGMTATVTFIVDERQDALLLPNAVLQFQPSEAMLAQYLKDHPEIQANAQNRQNAGSTQTSASPTASPAATPSPSPTSTLTDAERAARRQQYAQRRNAQNQGDQSGQGGQSAQGNNPDRGNGNTSGPQSGNGNPNRQGGLTAFIANNPNVKFLWSFDEKGKLTTTPVRLGISDGQKTEIISNRVNEGMKFLTTKGTTKKTNSNQRDGGGPGPFMFH